MLFLEVKSLIYKTLLSGTFSTFCTPYPYFSPIKFQADMGILLTFMFLWNMVGALTLLPALAYMLGRKKRIGNEDVVPGGVAV